MRGETNRRPAPLPCAAPTLWLAVFCGALLIGSTGAHAGRGSNAGEASESDVEDADQVLLRGPSLKNWEGLRIPPPEQISVEPKQEKDYPYLAVARRSEVLIHGAYGSKAWLWGKVRMGQRVPVKFKVAGQGCSRGNWYQTKSGAYLCNSHGYTITSGDLDVEMVEPPRLTDALPYTYYKGIGKPTVRFESLPSEKAVKQALAAAEGEDDAPSAMEDAVEGAYFIALDGKVSEDAGTFYRSTRGRYVRKEDLEAVKPVPMHGELLDKQTTMPLAFVHLEEAPLWCLPRGASKGAALRHCGRAERHARFSVARTVKRGGVKYLVSARGHALPESSVRLAKAISRPRSVDKDERWVHFDLGQQTMVAYEGDTPVFATLISSGKRGHTTPRGSYRLYLKQVSDRMKGDDPKDGPYDIGEVPWVMYYKSSYAVHGAYWHNTFGNVRSHGCTNLAPADARWLYFWTEPDVPLGWHTKYARKGTLFYYTP